MYGALGVPKQFTGKGGVEELHDLTVAWCADDDHLGVMVICKIRNATTGTAMTANNSKKVACTSDASRVKSVNIVGNDGASCVEWLQVDGQLFYDVGLEDVEDFDGPIE